MTTVAITIIKWLLILLALYSYIIIVLYYFDGYLSPSSFTDGNTLRAEQLIDGPLSRVVMETKNVTGYVLASDFYQQQTGAAINLFNFQTWAATMSPEIRVVEPFVARSKFIIPHDLSPSSLQAMLRFSDYFDIDYWNHNSGLDPLVPWEQFVTDRPNKMIVVIIVHTSTGRVVWEDDGVTENKNCYAALQQFNYRYNHTISNVLNLTVVRQVCFTFGNNINESLSVKDFNHYIFKQWTPSEVVVWFTCWSGITRGRMTITDRDYQLSSKPYKMIRTSSRVNDDSVKYKMNYLQPNYTAVSIRTVKPWMILSKKHDLNYVKDYLINCIRKLGIVLENIQSTQHIYGRPFLAIDLGSYGDMSAKKFIDKETMKQLLEGAVDVVYQSSTSVEEWEESFLTSIGRRVDKGYIAAVQAALVENADCVVMVGGYSRFQYTIMMNYIDNHHNTACIHRVCYGE